MSLEEGTANDKPVVMLVFRNKFGSVMYQAQLMKNITRLTKKVPPKPHKIQRLITVVGKKEDGKTGLVKCMVTLKSEHDCEQFKAGYLKAVQALPEIVKSTASPSKDKKPEPKKESESKKEAPTTAAKAK